MGTVKTPWPLQFGSPGLAIECGRAPACDVESGHRRLLLRQHRHQGLEVPRGLECARCTPVISPTTLSLPIRRQLGPRAVARQLGVAPGPRLSVPGRSLAFGSGTPKCDHHLADVGLVLARRARRACASSWRTNRSRAACPISQRSEPGTLRPWCSRRMGFLPIGSIRSLGEKREAETCSGRFRGKTSASS
jgi:hypothetical protein